MWSICQSLWIENSSSTTSQSKSTTIKPKINIMIECLVKLNKGYWYARCYLRQRDKGLAILACSSDAPMTLQQLLNKVLVGKVDGWHAVAIFCNAWEDRLLHLREVFHWIPTQAAPLIHLVAQAQVAYLCYILNNRRRESNLVDVFCLTLT